MVLFFRILSMVKQILVFGFGEFEIRPQNYGSPKKRFPTFADFYRLLPVFADFYAHEKAPLHCGNGAKGV